MKISKEFKFEMAHKLENSYTCKCQNLHGHSYKAFVELSRCIGKDGVVTDFTLVKEEVGFVFDWLDHAIMLKDLDTVTTILKPLAASDILKKVLVTNREPTAENIALWVFAVINDSLLSNSSLEGVKLESVTIYETATSKAIITAEDFSKETPMEVTFFNVTDEPLKETPLYRNAYLMRDINLKQAVLKSVDSFAEKFSLKERNMEKEIFEGFDGRYKDLLTKLVEHSYKKFVVHKHKGDWRKNPNKNLWCVIYKELCEEVEELNEAWVGPSESFYDELGDVFNYLIIALDLKLLEEAKKKEKQ